MEARVDFVCIASEETGSSWAKLEHCPDCSSLGPSASDSGPGSERPVCVDRVLGRPKRSSVNHGTSGPKLAV